MAKIMLMQNVEKGRLLEVATKLYLEQQGFKVYFWQEWASQKGLPLQDTGIDLVAEKDGDLPEHPNLTITADENALKEYVERVRLRLF